jgi:hypothetical protein
MMLGKKSWAAGLFTALVAAGCGSDDDNGGTGGTGAEGGVGGAATGGAAGAATGGAAGAATGGAAGSTTGGTGGVAPTGGTGGALPDAGTTISLTYKVVVAGAGVGLEDGLAGAEVCVVDEDLEPVDATDLCATTDADGMFTLEGLTPGERILLRYEKDGYVGGLSAVTLGTADMTPGAQFRMAPNPADGGVFQPPGWDPAVTADMTTKGSFNAVAVQAVPSDGGSGATGTGFDWASGVTFSITPSGGDGPFYVDADELFVSGATSTSGGWGAWFINLTPGTFTVSASHATLTCNSVGNVWGWMNTDGTADVPVYAGLNTQSIVFLCSTPAP